MLQIYTLWYREEKLFTVWTIYEKKKKKVRIKMSTKQVKYIQEKERKKKDCLKLYANKSHKTK